MNADAAHGVNWKRTAHRRIRSAFSPGLVLL